MPSLDQATRRAPVEVEVPNTTDEPLLAWSFVRARIDAAGEVRRAQAPGDRAPPRLAGRGRQGRGRQGAASLHVVHAIDEDGSWIVRERPADVRRRRSSTPDPERKDGDVVEADK